MSKIGIYSGSFNPIHNGHIALAEYIVSRCGLDEVWLVVSPNNPLKKATELLDENLRLRMVDMAIKDSGKKCIRSSDIEFSMPKPSYTINTLQRLTELYPKHNFSLIIGADNMALFNRWKDYELILRDFQIIVYPRKGDDILSLSKVYPQMTILADAPLFDVSSTMIRSKIKEGEDISPYVSPSVCQMLYQISSLC